MVISFFMVLILPNGLYSQPPHGWRYPRVGGTRQRHFDGTNLKPRNLLENAHAAQQQSHKSGARCVRRWKLSSLAELGRINLYDFSLTLGIGKFFYVIAHVFRLSQPSD